MSRDYDEIENREAQQAYFAKQKGYFECVGCGGLYPPEEMSALPNLCKNCDYDNNKHDQFEKD
ncbi:hypothetical protein [Leuconostoc citreum]|uniref:hypothetical protein n=1 Tax=Leuconostoc citreum TaxID=33964 RepID=UPI001910A534|nr:hypothetical protein [Leuconostoc citreum]QQE97572.1 hypothetical protein LeuC0096_05215 [Leuconostoc citreum]